MSDETEKEIAALMAQCRSALVDYSNRTGASVFSDAPTEPAAKSTVVAKAVSEQALTKMAKSLETSSVANTDQMAKLDARLAAKVDDLEDLKHQREVVEQEKEAARQADLSKKRQSMSRNSDSEPVTQGENEASGKVAFGRPSRG
jgi:uncharacterized protein with von Willebrand factor type A (vWA) domain